MAVITPQTDVYLLKVPLEMDDYNQITFASKTAQYNYFNSLPKLEVDNFTYQRKDGTIRFGANFDDIIQYNYVMYRNDAYSNKWFYAFITGMEYLNDNVTAISIKTDVFQTWQFDLTYKRTFVEREHVNDDTYGAHTVPESLETGEYVRSANGTDYYYNGEYYLAFQVTELISNMSFPSGSGSRIYNGVYNGLTIIMTDTYSVADHIVEAYDDASKHDAIISCFYIPKVLCSNATHQDDVVLHGVNCRLYYPKESGSTATLPNVSINRPTTIDGYTPKNNKLFCYPYCYLYVTNNAGVDITYNFEDWRLNGVSRTVADFRMEGVLTQGCSIKCYPETYYKMPPTTASYTAGGYSYGINGGKLPLCSWNSDYYTNWCTQNAINQPLSVASSVTSGIIGAGASLLTGNVAGMIGSVANAAIGVGQAIDQKYQASLVPDQAKGNVNAGDFNFSRNKQFTFYAMTIRNEMAKIIDQYFTMYGYKVNTLKVPNVTGRRNWNYVKTIGCYIDGDIPQTDMQEIKDMFNNGVTFWHNPSTFADYSQNNDII